MLNETFNVTDLSFPAVAPTPDYAQSLESIAPNITTLTEQNRQGDEPWYESLARLLPAIAATQQQRELLKVQTERARQGLPPLDVSQYGLGVRVGLSEDSKQLLIYGGVALLALVGFGVIKLGRRN